MNGGERAGQVALRGEFLEEVDPFTPTVPTSDNARYVQLLMKNALFF
jgi:hypothetical protein